MAVLIASVYIYPLLFMIATAFKPEADYIANPAGWPVSITLEHFQRAWVDANLGQALVNSLISSSVAVVVSCVICSTAAFWFLRKQGRFPKLLLASFGSLWMIPMIVWIIPLFLIVARLGLTDNLVVLGLVYGSVFAPGFLWLLWAYFLQGIPSEVMQAGEVDGASSFQLYRRIVLPLSLPALATVGALTFLAAWGDLLLAVILLQNTSNLTVVPAAATLIGRMNPAVQDTTAAAVISMPPPLIMFLLAQRAIVRGVTGGFSR